MKLFKLAVSALIVFSFIACGSSSEDTSKPTTDTTGSATQNEQQTPEVDKPAQKPVQENQDTKPGQENPGTNPVQEQPVQGEQGNEQTKPVVSKEFKLVSSDIQNAVGLANDFVHTECGGTNLSPALSWENIPENTKSFAISVIDPDGGNWVHWLVSNIPANITSLQKGASNANMPAGSVEYQNTFLTKGYGGACPPAGESHSYVFTIYALDVETLPQVNANSDVNEVKNQLDAHTIKTSTISPVYKH